MEHETWNIKWRYVLCAMCSMLRAPCLMIIFSAIVPHPPLLVPGIGKDNIKKLKKTTKALEDLEGKLYVTKPDVLMIISPHGEAHENATTIALDSEYEVNFREFGDFETGAKFRPDLELIERLRRELRLAGHQILIQHERPLNHGASVPLIYLNKHLKDAKIVPLLTAHHNNLRQHFEVGKSLKDVIVNSSKRIAVIASADLSHRLSSDAPAGFSPKAKTFNEEVQKLLEAKNSAGILKFSEDLLDEVEVCGLRSITLMLGLIDRINTTTQIFSYEAPFGVGYLVANFKIS